MNDIEILLEKAKVYFLSQNYNEAEKLFLKILEIEPDNLDALYHLGVLKEVIHDIE
ncbi:MAG: tetratricopeptide repeat protein, partial [Candidatus Hydrothermae bacterium]|nr:tetratricopeptide repeat protein [Candidatus Hydrothermae bacterium]